MDCYPHPPIAASQTSHGKCIGKSDYKLNAEVPQILQDHGDLSLCNCKEICNSNKMNNIQGCEYFSYAHATEMLPASCITYRFIEQGSVNSSPENVERKYRCFSREGISFTFVFFFYFL